MSASEGLNARDILAIIPAYRSPDELKRCVQAVHGQTVADRIAIYVHDNSQDNIYYTAAINEGLRLGLKNPNFTFFLVLTQDCFLLNNAVEQLVAFMDQYSGVGIAAPVHLDPNDLTQAVWAGSERSFPEGRGFRGALADLAAAAETAWASGAAFMVRRDVLIDIGLMDENMKFVCSDADFSFSARARGWQVVWISKACCLHEPSGALEPGNSELLNLIRKDMVYFADKWITGGLFRSLEFHGESVDIGEMCKQRNAIFDLISDSTKHHS